MRTPAFYFYLIYYIFDIILTAIFPQLNFKMLVNTQSIACAFSLHLQKSISSIFMSRYKHKIIYFKII